MPQKHNKTKRVAICSTAYLPDIGGAEIAVQETTNRIRDVHFDLFTVSHTKNTLKQETIGNVTVHRIGFGFWGKITFPMRAYIAISRIHRKHSFDSVWGIMASYGGFSAYLFKIFHPKVRFILSIQEGDSIEHINKRIRFFRPVYKNIFKKADHIHAISNFLASFAREQGYKKDISVIPNGVDLTKFEEPKEKDYSGDISIITTSRLVYKNGVDILILAMRFLPVKFSLKIFGAGPNREDLEELVAVNNLSERISFCGSIPPYDIPKVLGESHIFVRPSRSEGLGNSFLEAFASGVPVIGTCVGGIPDFLFDPEKNPNEPTTGIFAEVDNPESVAEAVLKISEDTDLRRSMIKNARELVIEKYDWNKIAHDIEKII